MITIKVRYSRHALEKIDGYGIDLSEVERTVKQGMKWKEEETEKWHANMAGLECVFTKEGVYVMVITVYLAGGEK